MNIIALSLLCAAALVLPSCAGSAGRAPAQQEHSPAQQEQAAAGPRFQIVLEPGSHYRKDMKVFLFGYTVYPQVAVWVETEDGRYIDTIYATAAVVSQKFRAAPKEGRPEALPIWSALRTSGADGVSAPTAVGAAVRSGSGLAGELKSGTYVVKLETNRSYDWNGTYTKENSGVNGQPSLLYEAVLRVGDQPDRADFVPIGVGAVDGSDGTLRPGLEGIDTALQLFSSMQVTYETE